LRLLEAAPLPPAACRVSCRRESRSGQATAPSSETPRATPAEAPSAAYCEAGSAASLPPEPEGVVVGEALLLEVSAAEWEGLADSLTAGTQLVRSGALVLPGGQGVHKTLPGAGATRPVAQGAHEAAEEEPAALLAVPAGHSTQAAPPLLHVPAGQGGPQKGEPGGVSVPCGQCEQLEEPGREKVPAAHSVQGQEGPPAHASPAGHVC
jgi:hypothetical protein